MVTAEIGSKEARTSITDFVRKGYSLYSVDLALAESLNALWKHVQIHRDLKTEEARSAVQDLTKVWDSLNVLSTGELSEEAVDLALTHDMSIYDSLYISAARKLDATLYTADGKLHNASKNVAASKLLKGEQDC